MQYYRLQRPAANAPRHRLPIGDLLKVETNSKEDAKLNIPKINQCE